MDKFKVGDRVRATQYAYPEYLRGLVGTVQEVYPPSHAASRVNVYFDDSATARSTASWVMWVGDPLEKDELELELETPPAPAAAAAAPRILADDGNREQYPLYDGLVAYFPAALCEIARWSKLGNDKHNPGEKLHWARDKSNDHENKILRHLLDARQVDQHGFPEAVALAWRALALCQTILEERGWAEGANARRTGSAK